jgi:hypothetical protein
MLALTVLLALQGTPDERAVRELIRQLDDDSAETRERATKSLSDLDPAALPLLRQALEGASPEVGTRLGRAIRRIEDLRLLRAKLRPARLVTLEAKDRPLAEILGEIARQGATPLDLSGLPEPGNATVSFSRVPFWEAMDRACAPHGRVTFDVDSGRPRLLKADRDEPRRHAGPLLLVFKGAEAPKDGKTFSLSFLALWEKGTVVDGLSFDFRELKDDQGTDFLAEAPGEDPFQGNSSTRTEDFEDTTLRSGDVLPEAATKLARLSVRAGFHFVLRSVTMEFKDPAGAPGQTKTGEGVSVQLERFEAGEKAIGGSLVIELAEKRSVPSDLVSCVLRSEDGKETWIRISDIERGRLQTAFSVGDGIRKLGKISSVRVTIPTSIHTETIDLELRDVPLRR